MSLCRGLLQLLGTPLPLVTITEIKATFQVKRNRAVSHCRKSQRKRLHLREVHGVPGPVVHQLVEVVCKGSFPLLGGRQALRAPLALGQHPRAAHSIGAVCPCRRGQRQGRRKRSRERREVPFTQQKSMLTGSNGNVFSLGVEGQGRQQLKWALIW